ncbi:hypothetical protein D3C87_1552420 [compost metagenome]
MAAALGRQQGEERLVVDIAQQLFAVFARIVITKVGAQGPVAQRLAVLEADKALVVDIFQLAEPGADRSALFIEGVIGAGEVEAITADLALRYMTEHRLHLFVAGLVAQAG